MSGSENECFLSNLVNYWLIVVAVVVELYLASARRLDRNRHRRLLRTMLRHASLRLSA